MLTQLVWLVASILIGTLQTGLVLYNVVVIGFEMALSWCAGRLRHGLRWVTWPLPSRWRRKHQVWQLMRRLRDAVTYDEWLAAARQLDELEGGLEWRAARESDEYDYHLVDETTTMLRRARKGGDVAALAFMLRTCMIRGYGGMDRGALYTHAHTGTKRLIDALLTEVGKCLETVAAAPDDVIPVGMKAEFFETCRLSLGRTALALSGGGSLAMTHMGVVRTLLAAGLLPRVIAGTSGGSIVAAMLALYTDDELLKDVLQPDIVNRYPVRFFDPLPVQIWRFVKSALTMGAPRMMESEAFSHTLQTYFGNETFATAFARTGRIVNIAVTTHFGAATGATPLVLNYLTTPNVLIYSAVAASCAAPGLMRPVTLMALTHTGTIIPYHPVPGVNSLDGSVAADIPSQAMGLLFHCNRTIVSQVNPHVVPFMGGDTPRASQIDANPLSRTLYALEFALNLDVRSRTKYLAKMRLLPKFFGAELSSLLLQRYGGDVTIMPHQPFMSQWRALSQPSPADMARFIQQGQRATWPVLSHIRTLVSIEKKLGACARRFAGAHAPGTGLRVHEGSMLAWPTGLAARVPSVAGGSGDGVEQGGEGGGPSAGATRPVGGDAAGAGPTLRARVQSYTIPAAVRGQPSSSMLAALASPSISSVRSGGSTLPTVPSGVSNAGDGGMSVVDEDGGGDSTPGAEPRSPVPPGSTLTHRRRTASGTGSLDMAVSAPAHWPHSPFFTSTLGPTSLHRSATATAPMSSVSSVHSMSPLLVDEADYMVQAGRTLHAMGPFHALTFDTPPPSMGSAGALWASPPDAVTSDKGATAPASPTASLGVGGTRAQPATPLHGLLLDAMGVRVAVDTGVPAPPITTPHRRGGSISATSHRTTPLSVTFREDVRGGEEEEEEEEEEGDDEEEVGRQIAERDRVGGGDSGGVHGSGHSPQSPTTTATPAHERGPGMRGRTDSGNSDVNATAAAVASPPSPIHGGVAPSMPEPTLMRPPPSITVPPVASAQAASNRHPTAMPPVDVATSIMRRRLQAAVGSGGGSGLGGGMPMTPPLGSMASPTPDVTAFPSGILAPPTVAGFMAAQRAVRKAPGPPMPGGGGGAGVHRTWHTWSGRPALDGLHVLGTGAHAGGGVAGGEGEGPLSMDEPHPHAGGEGMASGFLPPALNPLHMAAVASGSGPSAWPMTPQWSPTDMVDDAHGLMRMGEGEGHASTHDVPTSLVGRGGGSQAPTSNGTHTPKLTTPGTHAVPAGASPVLDGATHAHGPIGVEGGKESDRSPSRSA